MKNDDGYFFIEIMFDCMVLVLMLGVLNYMQIAARQLEISQSSVAAQLLCQEYTDRMSVDYRTKGSSLTSISYTKSLNGIKYYINSGLIESDKRRIHTKITWNVQGRDQVVEADRIVRDVYI